MWSETGHSHESTVDTPREQCQPGPQHTKAVAARSSRQKPAGDGVFWTRWLYNTVNALNATDLFRSKKAAVFYYVKYTSIII